MAEIDGSHGKLITAAGQLEPTSEVIVVVGEAKIHIVGRYPTELKNAMVAYNALGKYIVDAIEEANK